MNDFTMLRREFKHDQSDYGHEDWTCNNCDALEAIARIEEEVKRLRAENERLRAT